MLEKDKSEFALHALSPLDGRYSQNTQDLSHYFSEFALIRYRIQVEIEYFLALAHIPLPSLKTLEKNEKVKTNLKKIYQEFNTEEALKIKRLEKVTNHDVKAVEYYIKEKLSDLGLEKYLEFIHFGLTSQDINNTAIPLLFKDALENSIIPHLDQIIKVLRFRANEWAHIPMLAYTHGQVASPTRMGKEMMVFVERLEGQLENLKKLPHSAKFGGATGNFNAHSIAYPEQDWKRFADVFIQEKFGLKRSQYTTQIDNYDHLAAQLDALKRINTILMDLCRDIWQYISKHYFGQKTISGEIGSSAMPHKVNPIDFENAEGNLGLANALFEHLSAKLPISRLQRDLTDSTVLRNLGVPLGHSLISFKSILKGFEKLILNESVISEDLENNWVVVSEAIQTILRREGYPEPYEKLKELTRDNNRIDKSALHQFIESLQISEPVKKELMNISPFNFTGI